MKPLFVHRALFVVSVFSAGILLFACNKSDNNMNNNSPVSGFMAVNLATDKAVSISLSGSPLSSLPLAFTSYTGDYLSVNSASRPVETIDFNTNSILDSSTFNFEPARFYSLFVTGTNGHYRNVIVNDNFDSLPTGKAYVRYVNAIPDSSAPTVTITANGDNVVNNSAPFNSVSNFAAVTPGVVNIVVTNGGTINKSRTIPLDQQNAYTVLLAGVPGSSGNDSLQIKFILNGTVSQKTQKASSSVGSTATN